MKTTLLTLLLAVLFSGSVFGATHTISSNADWSDFISTSSGFDWGDVNDFDVISISSGVTLTIDVTAANHIQNDDVIIEVYGNINFDGGWGNYRELYLSGNSFIYLLGSGSVSATNCGDRKRIFFNGNRIADCPGSGTYDAFADINTAGGIGAAGPVPVDWVSYNAKLVSEGLVELTWTTATEKDNSHFEIEMSLDGIEWVFVDQVKSLADNGNSTSLLDYSYKYQLNNLNDVVYFRIKQVDFSGDFDYTNAIAVELEAKTPIIVETHGNGVATVKTKRSTSEGMIRVFDLKGQLLHESSLVESFEFRVETAGIYIIDVQQGSSSSVVKQYIF